MEFGVGSIVEGKVTSIANFGAFVTLPNGKSGLVHISEIARSYVNQVSDYLQEGQTVKVKVIGIDKANRINLSIKQATEPPPRSADSARPGRPGGERTGGFHSSNGGYHSNNGGYHGNSGSSGGGYHGGREGFRGGYSPRASAAAKEAMPFEDKLKQFMQSSDAKMSELKYLEKKGGNRRGNRK